AQWYINELDKREAGRQQRVRPARANPSSEESSSSDDEEMQSESDDDEETLPITEHPLLRKRDRPDDDDVPNPKRRKPLDPHEPSDYLDQDTVITWPTTDDLNYQSLVIVPESNSLDTKWTKLAGDVYAPSELIEQLGLHFGQLAGYGAFGKVYKARLWDSETF